MARGRAQLGAGAVEGHAMIALWPREPAHAATLMAATQMAWLVAVALTCALARREVRCWHQYVCAAIMSSRAAGIIHEQWRLPRSAGRARMNGRPFAREREGNQTAEKRLRHRAASSPRSSWRAGE